MEEEGQADHTRPSPTLNCSFVHREEMHYKAVHNTAVLFLQNDPGFAKWGPTPERLQELSTAYRQSGRSHGSGSSSSSSENKDRDSGREQGPSREPHPT